MRLAIIGSILLVLSPSVASLTAPSPTTGGTIALVDVRGFVANPAVTLTVVPPAAMTFPVRATLTADDARLSFSLPASASASGPALGLWFPDATTMRAVSFSEFPDHDALSEDHVLSAAFVDAVGRRATAVYPVHVTDLDGPPPRASLHVTVDFSQDTTGFFLDPAHRAIVQAAADDWGDLLQDPGYDTVPAGVETTWIWDATGFTSGHSVTNAAPYQGFLLYAYGIHTAALRSGGEGSYAGDVQHVSGSPQAVRRSGGIEVETAGNYNALGWQVDLDDAAWWTSQNLQGEKADLYSIVHHEIGHALAFNGAYARFAAAKGSAGTLDSPQLLAYHKAGVRIDAYDHFSGEQDDASQRGAFGNEYGTRMTMGRWAPTTLDVLAAQAVGYAPSDGDAPARAPMGEPVVVTARFP